MSLDRALWDIVKLLIGVGRTAVDQAGAVVSLVGLPNETREGASCALPGHYGVMKADRPVIFLRTGKGAIIIAHIVTPPDDAEAGDSGIVTDDGCHLRLRGKVLQVLDSAGVETAKIDVDAGTVTLARGTKTVVLDGDNVVPDVSFFAHTHSGVTPGVGTSGGVTPGPTTIGTSSSTATKTKAD